MAFPVVAATNTSTQATNSTSHTVNLPTGISAGHLLLIFFAQDNSGGGTASASGWTELFNEVDNQSNTRITVFYRFATGSEGSTVTVTTTVTEQSSHASLRITGAHASEVPANAHLAAPGSSVNPNPPSLNPANWDVEDTLWIATCIWDNSVGVTGSAYPTNYSGSQITVNPTSSTGVGLMLATRDLAAASEDPGTFTISASEQWAAATVAVRPAAGGSVTLIADQGSFAESGQAAVFNMAISVNHGSFS